MAKKKLLYVASHLSTGGMPQYLLKQIQTFKDEFEIQVVEYNDHSGGVFVVQKNQINDLVKLHTLYENKGETLLAIIDAEKPDIIHFTEIPEHFIEHSTLDKIFGNKKRKFDIVCSTHGSFTNPDEIKYQPDRYILVSEWSRKRFEHLGIDTKVWEYPIEDIKYDKDSAKEELGFEKDWKHVLMVGLFSEGKNQSEIFDIARLLQKYKIKFHFVGNQAINFESYWKPLMDSKPDNCVVWGERTDTDKFYKASDLFYFSSKLELNPLSIKEALSYGLPSIFRRLHTYLDTYDTTELVTYIDDDIYNTKNLLLEKLQPEFNEIPGWFSYQKLYDDVVDKLPNNSNIVEVGSWFGKSTNYLANKIKESGKKINFTTIDTFKGSLDEEFHRRTMSVFDNDIYTEFMDSTIMLDNQNTINVIKDTSVNAKDSFVNNSLDFIMIDAGHSYEDVRDDINAWFHKVKPGGIISGDDYIPLFQGVINAVDEYFYGQIQRTETGWFRKKPRIQIIHMMTRPDDVREMISQKSLKQLQRLGFDYKPMVNKVYEGLPPKEFCRRPDDISDKPIFKGDQGIGNITGRHYGCYLAHTNALKEIDTKNYDYTLIFEADAFIYSNLRDFVDIVYKACFISEKDNVPYIAFANNPSWKRWDVDSNFSKTDYNQDWAHAYLIPNREKGWYMDRIKDCEWDVADLWYNHVFYNHKRLRYTTHYPYSKQAEGVSLLDNTNKSWK
jgi:predicted O-methyltransferase YrrM/GR25 family glycosyltransferase involved in LPS biosynthesis